MALDTPETLHEEDLVFAPDDECDLESLSADLLEIGRRQQELATRLKRLLDGVVRRDRGEVHQVMAFLQEHVVDHFGLEERWMAKTGYPELAAHKAEHDAFMQEYVRFSVEVERKGATALIAMRVGSWLAAWLRRHGAGHDATLVGFLQER